MSTCAQKARVCLAEKGLDYTEHHLDLRSGDQQDPEYLKLNPRGVVPTLIDGQKVIRESNVILEYLDDEYPTPSLRPRDSLGKAQMRLWLKRFDEGLHDIATATISMGTAFRHQYLEKDDVELEALIEKIPDPIKRIRRRDVVENGTKAQEFRKAVWMMDDCMCDMQEQLERSEWLAGECYSLADVAYTPYLTRLDHLGLLGFIENRPQVSDWYQRVKARPSYTEAIVRWENKKYLALMGEKAAACWPEISAIIAERLPRR